MPAHSPGAWSARQLRHSVFVTTNCPEQMEVASVFGDNPDQARANALLLAAAPDLLQACLNAFATIEIDLGHIDSKHDREALNLVKRELRKAIIKAGYLDPQVDITMG